MKKYLKIGIIGAGMYAFNVHVPRFLMCDDVEIIAACRTRKDKLKCFIKKFNIPRGYTDYRSLLEYEELDGVLISSPNNLHYQHAKDTLEHNVSVLIEKPMTIKLCHAWELITLAHNRNLKLAVGYNRRYWSHYQRAKEFILNGKLGKITYVMATWWEDISWALTGEAPPENLKEAFMWVEGDSYNFKSDPESAGGGIVINCGSHLIDAILWLSGLKITEVFAQMNCKHCWVDMNASVTITFDNGALGILGILGEPVQTNIHELYFYGDRGILTINDEKMKFYTEDSQIIEVKRQIPESNPTANFVSALRDEEKIYCTGEDGANVVQVIEAIYKSSATNQKVIVE